MMDGPEKYNSIPLVECISGISKDKSPITIVCMYILEGLHSINCHLYAYV